MRKAYPPGYARPVFLRLQGLMREVPGESPSVEAPLWPFGPGGFLTGRWVAQLDGKELRREERATMATGGFYLYLPRDLTPGPHLLRATIEVSETASDWRHIQESTAEFEIDPELSPKSIVAPGSESFPQEKAVVFVEESVEEFEWEQPKGVRWRGAAPKITVKTLPEFDMDIAAREHLELEIGGKVYDCRYSWGGILNHHGDPPTGREYNLSWRFGTFKPQPDVPLAPGTYRWRIVLTPDLQWAWEEPEVDRLWSRKFVSPWYDVVIEKASETDEAKASPQPQWRKRFEGVYRLKKGEMLPHIPEPYVPERADFFAQRRRLHPDPFQRPDDELRPDPDSTVFLWNGREAKDYWANPRTLEDVLQALGLRLDEIRAPEDLLGLRLRGDWVLREKSFTKQRLQALARLVKEKFGRSVRFEKRRVEEDVIVVRGELDIQPAKAEKWETQMARHFASLPEPALTPIHVYVDSLDTGRFRILYADTDLSGLLRELGKKLRRKVIDETESSDILVGWTFHETFRREYIEEEPSRLDQLLENLSKQTSLQFRKEKRPVEVWLASDLQNMPEDKPKAGD